MENSFIERLRMVIALKKITQKKLSELIGVNERTVSRWRKTPPDLANVLAICDVTGCRFEYLNEGIGPMFGDNGQQEDFCKRAQEKGSVGGKGYRELAELDAETLGEIQTWINDTEKVRPGFTSWFRLEFQNRFPEFNEWNVQRLKKSA